MMESIELQYLPVLRIHRIELDGETGIISKEVGRKPGQIIRQQRVERDRMLAGIW